jgi:hypothetical protein
LEWPLIKLLNQSSTHWILFYVFPFLAVALRRAQNMIKKFFLPNPSALFQTKITDPRESNLSRDSFT